MPLAKVGHQKLAAKASCSLFKFMKPLKDCMDAGTKQIEKIKDAKGVKSAAEIASSRKLDVRTLRLCVT